ncbi:MAG: sulfite exporter TauE/SafE family protein [Actinobacteria bacterium]|nr:sulfite exporter TauE/SafE family protein [Actinomycetota bacterium]
MASSALIVVAGGGVGLLYGLFGVGSAFATPVLSLLGVPGMAAVVGPLPALLPGSAAGAWTYTRHGKVDWTIARRTLAGAVPAAVAGAAMSRLVGGPLLLLLSGAVLLAVGIRIVRGVEGVGSGARADARRNSIVFVVTSAAAVGFVSGLLANGGGFLLVPLLLVVLGLDMHEAAGTSLVVAVALTVPTIITHAFLGDLEWMLSLWFALGLVPGALAGARVAQRLPTARLKTLFGVLLVGFALWFLARQGLAYLG